MTETRKIIASITAKPGKLDELLVLLYWLRGETRQEPGNLRWDIWCDPAVPGRYVLDELYVDDDAVAAHRASPHFVAYLGQITDLAERTSAVLNPIEVA